MPRKDKDPNEIRSPLTRLTLPATITVLIISSAIVAVLLYRPTLGG